MLPYSLFLYLRLTYEIIIFLLRKSFYLILAESYSLKTISDTQDVKHLGLIIFIGAPMSKIRAPLVCGIKCRKIIFNNSVRWAVQIS